MAQVTKITEVGFLLKDIVSEHNASRTFNVIYFSLLDKTLDGDTKIRTYHKQKTYGNVSSEHTHKAVCPSLLVSGTQNKAKHRYTG